MQKHQQCFQDPGKIQQTLPHPHAKKTTDIHHCFIHYSCSVATKIVVKNPWYFTHSLLWSPVTWRVTHAPRGSLVYILTECPIFSTGSTHTARGPGKRKHEEGSVLMLNREKKPGRLWEEGVTGKSGPEGQGGTFIMATHVLLLKSSSLSNSQNMSNLKVRKEKSLTKSWRSLWDAREFLS